MDFNLQKIGKIHSTDEWDFDGMGLSICKSPDEYMPRNFLAADKERTPYRCKQ